MKPISEAYESNERHRQCWLLIQGLLEQGKTNNIVQTNLSGTAKRRLYLR